MCGLLRLSMMHLAMTATYQCSFSLVKLIGVDLWSTMMDERMNHYLSVAKYYPKFLIGINIEDVMSDFASENDLCIRQFSYVKRN